MTVVVRGFPIINDAILEDAVSCGLDRLCPVINNGPDVPGSPLVAWSETFHRRFRDADCIISKGTGKYERLPEVRAPLFFLFIVKCTTVLQHLRDRFFGNNMEIGYPVLLQGGANRA
jgi:uncharacterized protein with ATP-grasp and redox domains